jgi:hypothetical protein
MRTKAAFNGSQSEATNCCFRFIALQAIYPSLPICNAPGKNRRVYATVAFCHQRICKADIAPVDVSQAYREWGIKWR